MTKFKLGDIAHTMKNNKPYQFEVKAIFIRGEGYQTTLYDEKNPIVDNNKGYHEFYCYKTKEELIKSIFGE